MAQNMKRCPFLEVLSVQAKMLVTSTPIIPSFGGGGGGGARLRRPQRRAALQEGTCDSPPSAPTDMWDKDVVDRNPWDCISYTSLWTHRTVKAPMGSVVGGRVRQMHSVLAGRWVAMAHLLRCQCPA